MRFSENRSHHRLKTFHRGWRDVQLGDGLSFGPHRPGERIGRSQLVLTFSRSRAVRRARHRVAAEEADRGNGAHELPRRASTTASVDPSTRPDNCLKRPESTEIAARKFRNHMCDMLVLFKVTTSSRPFCTWVNGPQGAGRLAADWTPEERALQPPLNDDPPF